MSFNNDISTLIDLSIEENRSYRFDNSDEYKEIYNRVDDKSIIIDCMEEDLNCPLDVLFKAKEQQKIWTIDQWCSVEKIIVWDKSRKHKAYIDVKCDNGLHILASITDYKKSWWLKEDKSE